MNLKLYAAVACFSFQFISSPIDAAVSATIVSGSLIQGDVKASMAGNSYAVETNAMNDWCLNTGGGSTVYPVSLTNSNFNGSSWGGTPNTMIAFGNGGTVTLRLDQAVMVSSMSRLGLFTAQMIIASSGAFLNGNMEASILVSSDGLAWRSLTGASVTGDYTGATSRLNAPTMAYNYGTLARAWSYGTGTSPANLAALPIADYLTPMPDDSLFNGPGSNAARLAMQSNNNPDDYQAMFGTSGGGNWFDLSNTGLESISYVRLNGQNNSPGMGVRLDALYVIPEPSSSLLGLIGMVLLVVRRTR